MDEHSGWLAALQAACAHEACPVRCECTVEDMVSMFDILVVKHINACKSRFFQTRAHCMRPGTMGHLCMITYAAYACMFCSCLKV